MTDTERRYKAAFMALLRDYNNAVYELTAPDFENNYCNRFCPFPPGNCPARVYDDAPFADDDDYEIDPDKCYEEIFKWYVEKANG